MQQLQTQRRKVLVAISQLALLSSLTGCTGSGDTSTNPVTTSVGDSDLELLSSVAYDLYPYPDIPVALYLRIGEQLLQSNNPVVSAGLAQLRSAGGALPWKELDESVRLGILAMLENSAFFAVLRATSLEVLYRSPEVFSMVGYGGSAFEKGGYINRGFADIDWLPQE